jgi:hypothetical protein
MRRSFQGVVSGIVLRPQRRHLGLGIGSWGALLIDALGVRGTARRLGLREATAMPEGTNIQAAHKLSERDRANRARHRWQEVAEVLEVLVLAVPAVATAWSGYQAARGDGRQSVLYGESSRDRFQAEAASSEGGQQLVADSTMFNAWLQARAAGNPKLQAEFVRRFTPDYRSAFREWLKTDPSTSPTAPPGPAYMPQYRNPQLEEAKRLNTQASAAFAEGTKARETADRYVRVTVLFALVLFLVAVGQRFQTRGVRIGSNAIAMGLL